MSNLTLPSLSLANLTRIVADGKTRKIGYETLAAREGDTVTVYHHNSVIATLAPQEIYITNAGYGTPTTRARIHRVLVDNGLSPRYSVGQTNWVQVLVERGDKAINHKGFRSALFLPVGDTFELAAFNGQVTE